MGVSATMPHGGGADGRDDNHHDEQAHVVGETSAWAGGAAHARTAPMRETAKARAAFEAYCALGPDRSLARLAESNQRYTKSLPTLKKWSAQHHWQERCRLYDEEQAAARRRRRQEALDRMDEEHALIGRTQAIRAVKQIERLIEVEKFGSQAAVQLLKVATDLERLARGAATERHEQVGPGGGALQVGFYPVELPQKQPPPRFAGEPLPPPPPPPQEDAGEQAAARTGGAPIVAPQLPPKGEQGG